MKELKNILLYIIPISLISTILVSTKWVSESITDTPNLYGLIYPVRSDALGSSFAYEFYLKGILLNSIPYFIFGLIVYYLSIKRLKNTKVKTGISIGLWILLILIYSPFLVFLSEYSLKWDYSFIVEYKKFEFCFIHCL